MFYYFKLFIVIIVFLWYNIIYKFLLKYTL